MTCRHDDVVWIGVFHRRNVLSISTGIEDIGGLKWDLALCLLAVWVICFFCIWKGVKSTEKYVCDDPCVLLPGFWGFLFLQAATGQAYKHPTLTATEAKWVCLI